MKKFSLSLRNKNTENEALLNAIFPQKQAPLFFQKL